MKIIFAFLLWSIGAGVTLASPFLVCDPYAQQSESGLNVVSFVLTGLAANPVTTPATVNATDGSQYLHYDLSGLAKQSYTVTASAVNGYGGVSNPTGPFHVHAGGTSHAH
jgi:hypothetical protein